MAFIGTGASRIICRFNMSNQNIAMSKNVSSISHNETGRDTVNFSITMPNNNYGVGCSHGLNDVRGYTSYNNQSTTAIQMDCRNDGGSETNVPQCNVFIWDDE